MSLVSAPACYCAQTNISPQVGKGFNRHYWARFEKFVRELGRNPLAQRVSVTTGPLFLPKQTDDGKWVMSYPLIGSGPGFVAVPTHFFKVVSVQVSAACVVGTVNTLCVSPYYMDTPRSGGAASVTHARDVCASPDSDTNVASQS